MSGYDRLYVAFLYYFNVNRDYFECHEVMEELWLEEGRAPLYQGLLQVAVGLYHHRNGNPGGGAKLLTLAIEKLEYASAETLGINLAKLVSDSRIYLDKLLNLAKEPFEFYDLDIEIRDPGLKEALEALKCDPPRPHDEEETE